MDYSQYYLAFVLDEVSKEEIRKKWPPRFPQNLRTDHVTIAYDGVTKELHEAVVEDLGQSAWFSLKEWWTGEGIDMFTVEDIRGNAVRPDCGRYHLTHSFLDGRQAADSKKMFSGEMDVAGRQRSGLIITGRIELVKKS